jgi:hypothetical protein
MDPINIFQHLTYWEVARAHLYILFRTWRIWPFLLLPAFVLLIVPLTIITAPNDPATYRTIMDLLTPFSVVCIIYLCILLLPTTINFFAQPNLYRNLTYEFNHWGVHTTGKGFEHSKPWREFYRYKESRNFFFLYQSKKSALAFPKRVFPTEFELEDFRALLGEYCPDPSRR